MALDTLPPDVKEKLFEAVLNNSYHGIVALDAIPDDTGAIEDFRYFYVNLTAEKILHRKADELMGNRFLDVFPGIKDEGLFDTFVQVANTGRTVQFENEYRRDGLDASFEISVSQFRNGIVISFIETTEQTKMSRRLKKLSDRLKIATETAEVGIWEYDVKNDKLIWDDVMHRIFDVSKDKFEGTFESWAKTVHPADIDAAKANFSNALGENSDFHTNFRIIHPDGNIRWIEARARVEVDENGKPVRAIGTNWDFTDLMIAYEDLAVAKEHAEKANAAKSEFLAVMSHELRTPLNPIIGMTQLLKESLSDPDDKVMMETVENSAQSLLAIITDILDFCTLEEGRLKLDPTSLDIRKCTESVCKEFKQMAGEKDIQLTMKFDPQVPRSMLLDSKRYQQIIRNLVNNALKFTEAGTIEVALSTTHEGDSQKIVAEVRDTGPGIPADRIDFIFERFTQLDASNTREQGGTGLGLAICKRLSRLMGGRISVESKPVEGATFRLELPISVIPEAAGNLTCACECKTEKCRHAKVLLVDDEPSLFYMTKALHNMGAEIRSECDPLLGKASAMQEPFDIILLDLHMPNMSGVDLAMEIRKDGGANRKTPIVALTADARKEVIENCLQKGFVRVVTKPVRPQQIQEVICEILERSKLFSYLIRPSGRRHRTPTPWSS